MGIPVAERDMWVGGAPAIDREEEKDRLSKVMEVGAKGIKELERRERERQIEEAQRTRQNNPTDPKEALIDQVWEDRSVGREMLNGDQCQAYIIE